MSYIYFLFPLAILNLKNTWLIDSLWFLNGHMILGEGGKGNWKINNIALILWLLIKLYCK